MDLEKIKEEVDKFTRDEKVLNHLSGIFKVLADPTRLRIIYTLSMGELCVTDISETLPYNICNCLVLCEREDC